MEFSEISETEFTAYFLTVRGNYLQTKEMAALKKARGQEIFYVGVKDERGVVHLAALLTRVKIRIGYVFEIDGLTNEGLDEVFSTFIVGVKKFVKKNQGVSLTIYPDAIHKRVEDTGETVIMAEDLLARFTSNQFTHRSFSKEYSENGNPNWMYIKEIAGLSAETVQASYRKQAIYSIKKAKEFGVTVRELSYEELPLFKKITQLTSERRGFEDKSLAYYQAVFQTYRQKAKFMIAEIDMNVYKANLVQRENELLEQVRQLEQKLAENPKSRKRRNQRKELLEEIQTFKKREKEAINWMAEEGKSVIALACALFLISQSEVVYLFSGTQQQYKKMYAPFLIQDELIHYAVDKHIPLYNFYGIKGVFDGSDGVLTFKQAFNGFAIEKFGAFTCVIAPYKLKMYHLLKKIMRR